MCVNSACIFGSYTDRHAEYNYVCLEYTYKFNLGNSIWSCAHSFHCGIVYEIFYHVLLRERFSNSSLNGAAHSMARS